MRSLVPKLEDLRIINCFPEIKPTSVHRPNSEYELVESESQWKEVLRQTSGGGGVQVASVRRSQLEPDTGTHRSSHRPRTHKKHRSRSRSPNEKKWLRNKLE